MPSDFGAITLTGNAEEDISLLEIIDHVLNAGVVIHGSLVISVAGVDLVYVGLNVVLTSVETALRSIASAHVRITEDDPGTRE
jgi:gas vesicle structural protein